MALINGVVFHDASFNKENACNGFIVTFNNKNYAITAKHVLMIAKTDEMNSVSLKGHLKEWKMYVRNKPTTYLTTDQLLNADSTEKLNWDTLSNDWLVFSIKENNTNFKPLKFRTKPLVKGEQFHAVGWTYADQTGPQREYLFEYQQTEDELLTFKQITGPENMSGLSGSPVVDKDGLLVGLVSTGWKDEESNIVFKIFN